MSERYAEVTDETSHAVPEDRLRELVERLNQALMMLDFIDNAGANIAEITLVQADFVRGAIADAAPFVSEALRTQRPSAHGRGE
jgi:hypothetical protein